MAAEWLLIIGPLPNYSTLNVSVKSRLKNVYYDGHDLLLACFRQTVESMFCYASPEVLRKQTTAEFDY